MNDRLIALAGALLSIALVVGLMVPTPRQSREPPSLPTTADRGGAGLAGAAAWLEARGTATKSLRVRYDGLSELEGPATGNMLVLHLPRLRRARPNELEALRQWLRRGNTAVVLAAVASRPEWFGRGAARPSVALDELELDLVASDQGSEGPITGAEERATVAPAIEHPLTLGVEALSVGATRRYLAPADDADTPWLTLFGDDQGASVLARPYGDGAVVVSAHPGLFGNDPLREADNAQLLANLVARYTSDAGRVVFDDFHVGLSRLYDAEAFFSDPRLHTTLMFLAAFWLLCAVGHNNRLAPPRRAVSPASTSGFTEAVAGLLARRCERVGVAQALLGHFFDDVRRRHGLPENGQPAWGYLRERPELAAEAIDRLRAMADRLDRGQRVSLQRLTRTIAHIQENLR